MPDVCRIWYAAALNCAASEPSAPWIVLASAVSCPNAASLRSVSAEERCWNTKPAAATAASVSTVSVAMATRVRRAARRPRAIEAARNAAACALRPVALGCAAHSLAASSWAPRGSMSLGLLRRVQTAAESSSSWRMRLPARFSSIHWRSLGHARISASWVIWTASWDWVSSRLSV